MHFNRSYFSGFCKQFAVNILYPTNAEISLLRGFPQHSLNLSTAHRFLPLPSSFPNWTISSVSHNNSPSLNATDTLIAQNFDISSGNLSLSFEQSNRHAALLPKSLDFCERTEPNHSSHHLLTCQRNVIVIHQLSAMKLEDKRKHF